MDKLRKPINGVGVLFYSQNTDRILYLLRNHKEQVWGIPGGKVERSETLLDALERECREEIGYWPDNAKLYPLDCYRSNDGKFQYHTFFTVIDSEFFAILNNEHLAYAWYNIGAVPTPLHYGLHSTMTDKIIRQKIKIILDTIRNNSTEK